MRILGIEFGSWSLKAVELEFRFRRMDILDFHEVRLSLQEPNPTLAYKEAIEQLMARLPSHPEKIVTSLPAGHTALRFLPIPVKQRKKVEQMFRFELEDNIPFKLEDAIVEHYVTRTKVGSLVFAAIAPKKLVLTHIDWLRSLGVDPDWLTFEGMGVINLYLSALDPKAKPLPDDEGPVMLLDIGHTKTNVALLNQDRLEFFRSIPFGGAAITQAIALQEGVSLEEAERYKMNDLRLDEAAPDATEASRELLHATGRAFTPLMTDLSHSIVAFRNLYKTQLKEVLITGGTSKIWGIETFISRSLDLPVSQFKPFAGLTLKDGLAETDEARFGETLGRATVFARKSPLLFNFRQQEMTKGTSLTEVSTILQNPAVLKLLKFSGILAGVLFFHVFVAGYLAENEAKMATEELRKVFSQVFPNVPTKQKTSLTKSPKELKKFVEQKNKEMDQKLKMASNASGPMMGLILKISDAFPPDVRVDVNVLQVDDHTFSMDGVLYSGDLNRTTEALKKIKSLAKVTLNRSGQRFTYRGEVVGR